MSNEGFLIAAGEGLLTSLSSLQVQHNTLLAVFAGTPNKNERQKKGIITSLIVRVRRVPNFISGGYIVYPQLHHAVECVKLLMQHQVLWK